MNLQMTHKFIKEKNHNIISNRENNSYADLLITLYHVFWLNFPIKLDGSKIYHIQLTLFQ